MDHRILITGGGRGLGAGIGASLAAEGMTVGLVARTAAELESTTQAILESGGRATYFPCDVLDFRELERTIERFCDWAGGIDAVVCAAGGMQSIGPFRSADPDCWRRDIETAVVGVGQTVRAALSVLVESHRASVSVLVGPGHNQSLKNASAYAAAQAALVRLVETWGAELAADGIHVYAVNPGIVPTRMMARLTETAEGRRWLPQFIEAFAEGKEVPTSVAAAMISWLIERRPSELNGRVVAALGDPTFLETRLETIQAEDRSILRLR